LKETVEREGKVFEYKNVKVIYIVDYQQFDCVIDLGCKLTIRQRLAVKGLADVDYKQWSTVKRLLSDTILNTLVDIKTYNSKNFYGIYDAEIFINGEFINSVLNKQIQGIVKPEVKEKEQEK
jgi:hypothetical protein